MEIKYTTSSSNEEPVLLDTTSSETHVYIRRNVKLVTKTDAEGNEYQEYEYEEAQLTKAEYAAYTASIETDLALAELAELMEQDKLDMELAIAELAESLITE